MRKKMVNTVVLIFGLAIMTAIPMAAVGNDHGYPHYNACSSSMIGNGGCGDSGGVHSYAFPIVWNDYQSQWNPNMRAMNLPGNPTDFLALYSVQDTNNGAHPIQVEYFYTMTVVIYTDPNFQMGWGFDQGSSQGQYIVNNGATVSFGPVLGPEAGLIFPRWTNICYATIDLHVTGTWVCMNTGAWGNINSGIMHWQGEIHYP